MSKADRRLGYRAQAKAFVVIDLRSPGDQAQSNRARDRIRSVRHLFICTSWGSRRIGHGGRTDIAVSVPIRNANVHAALVRVEEWEPVPVQVMIGCFVVAGFIVAAVYGIDWNTLF
jgi:hypothetical protein